jgi:hypothetical protein
LYGGCASWFPTTGNTNVMCDQWWWCLYPQFSVHAHGAPDNVAGGGITCCGHLYTLIATEREKVRVCVILTMLYNYKWQITCNVDLAL